MKFIDRIEIKHNINKIDVILYDQKFAEIKSELYYALGHICKIDNMVEWIEEQIYNQFGKIQYSQIELLEKEIITEFYIDKSNWLSEKMRKSLKQFQTTKGDNLHLNKTTNYSLNSNRKINKSRYNKQYIDWMTSAKKRDNYTCKCCGTKKKSLLHEHHIKNYSEHISLRYEISNGETLCKYCHESFHQLYGKRFNNREQLEKFKMDYRTKQLKL